MRLAVNIVAALALAPVAGATDLVNKDNVPYIVSIVSKGGKSSAQIAPKSTMIAVCPATAAKCIVVVETVGEIEVTGADDVIVENARLSKN